jgi:hypothetical protein
LLVCPAVAGPGVQVVQQGEEALHDLDQGGGGAVTLARSNALPTIRPLDNHHVYTTICRGCRKIDLHEAA